MPSGVENAFPVSIRARETPELIRNRAGYALLTQSWTARPSLSVAVWALAAAGVADAPPAAAGVGGENLGRTLVLMKVRTWKREKVAKGRRVTADKVKARRQYGCERAQARGSRTKQQEA